MEFSQSKIIHVLEIILIERVRCVDVVLVFIRIEIPQHDQLCNAYRFPVIYCVTVTPTRGET